MCLGKFWTLARVQNFIWHMFISRRLRWDLPAEQAGRLRPACDSWEINHRRYPATEERRTGRTRPVLNDEDAGSEERQRTGACARPVPRRSYNR